MWAQYERWSALVALVVLGVAGFDIFRCVFLSGWLFALLSLSKQNASSLWEAAGTWIAAFALVRSGLALVWVAVFCAVFLSVRSMWRRRKLPPAFPYERTWYGGHYRFFMHENKKLAQRFRRLGMEYPRSCFAATIGPYPMPLETLVVINEPRFVEQMFLKYGTELMQPPHLSLQVGRAISPHSILGLDDEPWKLVHKHMIQYYSVSHLKTLPPRFVEHLRVFSRILDAEYGDGKPCDTLPILTKLTIDIMCDVALSVNVGMQEGQNEHFTASLLTVFDALMRTTFSPFAKLPAEHPEALKTLADFNKAILNERLRLIKDKGRDAAGNDFSGIFARALHDGTLELDVVLGNLLTVMLGGFETTSNTFGFLLNDLAQNQDVQQRLYEEICSVLTGDRDDPTYEEIQTKFPYMQCVIRESQRMNPVGYGFGRRCKRDMEIENFVIPANTAILVNTMGMSYNADLFPGPERFNPERWSGEMQHPDLVSWASLPFGAGFHQCQGRKLASLELAAIVIYVVKLYQILPVKEHEFRSEVNFTLKPITTVSFRKRNKK